MSEQTCACKHWFPKVEDREKCPIHASALRPEGHDYWNGGNCTWQRTPMWLFQKRWVDREETQAMTEQAKVEIPEDLRETYAQWIAAPHRTIPAGQGANLIERIASLQRELTEARAKVERIRNPKALGQGRRRSFRALR